MSRKYRFGSDHHAHFVTFTIVDWIDLFTREQFREAFVKAIGFYQEHKGLEVFGYCFMTSHVHLIVRARESHKLGDIIRDLKSFSSRQFHEMLEDENNHYESRKSWLLWLMKRKGALNSNTRGFQLWQQHNHPIELINDELFYQKLDYIHMNPVVARFVDQPEQWRYSSAIDYAGGKGVIQLVAN